MSRHYLHHHLLTFPHYTKIPVSISLAQAKENTDIHLFQPNKIYDISQSQEQCPCFLCNSVSALFPNERFPNESLYSTVCLFVFSTLEISCPVLHGLLLQFFRSHHNWKEVCGRVLPAGFFPPQRLPVDIQTHKHLTLLVPPHRWCVGVVAILLDPLFQGTVNTKLSLKQNSKCRLITLLNARWGKTLMTSRACPSWLAIFKVHTSPDRSRVRRPGHDSELTRQRSKDKSRTLKGKEESNTISASGASRLTPDPDTHRSVQFSLPADSQVVVAVQPSDGHHSHIHWSDFQNTY